MAKHEFGIMPEAPEKCIRYDEYEPEKYGCVSVDDDFLEDRLAEFAGIDFYWHTLAVSGKGLAYCGITLIPPNSMPAFIEVIASTPELYELSQLMQKAYAEQKWVIHFGL